MNSASLELKFIAERIRNRFGLIDSFENSVWDPKVMDVPPGHRFLVISPHPDDDAIGCMGTLLKLHDDGKSVRILYACMQTGNFSSDARLKEIENAVNESGILDYRLNNSSYPDLENLKDMIQTEISDFNPDAIFVPSPFENHNEHLRAFRAVVDILKDDDSIDIIMYEVWGALMPNLVIPVTETMDRKLSVIRMHKTQMEDIDYVKMTRGINEYRAAMNRISGYAESFLSLSGKDAHEILNRCIK